jgi:hypothetical protein
MRTRWLLPVVGLALLASPATVQAIHGSRHSHGHKSKSSSAHSGTTKSHATKKCATCARSSHSRIHRSTKARADFERQTGHPHGWPGHVVDHIKPLECGGADVPSNMRWQTIAAAKAKDRTERACR